MDLKDASTANITGATTQNEVNPLEQAGLGDLASRGVLDTAYRRIMQAQYQYLVTSTKVSIGGVSLAFHQIDFTALPQPLKRKLVQLKNSELDLPDEQEIPGLAQFVGSLDNQYLYLVEHPENIFLAHMGRIIAYSKR